jgi:glycyl-tRNA synthetase
LISDIRRTVLTLKPQMAPFHAAIFQLSNKDNLLKYVDTIHEMLNGNSISCFIDRSGTSIGKRYVRADEIGIKYCITVDFKTLETNTVTIRNRDNMTQSRVSIEGISGMIFHT